MSKFNESESVVWQGEFCKVLSVSGDEYTIKNFHSDSIMTVEEPELRKPKQGEFLNSSSLNDPGENNGPEILTKSRKKTQQ